MHGRVFSPAIIGLYTSTHVDASMRAQQLSSFQCCSDKACCQDGECGPWPALQHWRRISSVHAAHKSAESRRVSSQGITTPCQDEISARRRLCGPSRSRWAFASGCQTPLHTASATDCNLLPHQQPVTVKQSGPADVDPYCKEQTTQKWSISTRTWNSMLDIHQGSMSMTCTIALSPTDLVRAWDVLFEAD